MYLIKAIPISRGVNLDALSYWSPKDAAKGAVIRVPLRKRTIGALVVSSETAEESKSEIRSADFEVRKIANPHSRSIIFHEFYRTAEEAARYYACSTGSALFELLSGVVLSSYDKAPAAGEFIRRPRPRDSFVLQKNDEDRFAHYKSLIRERFARKESVFMMMPSVEDIKKACAYFEKGIEPYTYIIHSELPKAEIMKRWKEAVTVDHPVIIVATGSFLSIPRRDLGVIIVERENSRSYKSRFRPFLDWRHIASIYAKEIGADLIAGDSCLRVETLYKKDEGEFVEYASLSMRSLSTARDVLIDMKAYKNPNHDIRVISDELALMVKKNRAESGLLFIFAGRKGLSPQTICSDCETTLACEKCSSPLVLYGKDSGRFFLCNTCGKRYAAEQTCKSCGGWRLTSLGIGTERVEDELRKSVPEAKIFRLDKVSSPSHKKALDIVEKWYSSPGSVLIGTEMALLYLDRSIDYSAVASLDSLFSIPDFRINEKIFSIILKMRSITQKEFILQTRMPEAHVLSWGAKGNIIDFYRDEIDVRREFSFPPFSTFIKISYAGKKDDVLRSMDELKAMLSGWHIDVFPAFIATVDGDFIMHALLKLKPGAWVDKELLEKLKSLPPSYSINVDPESVL